MDGEEAVLLLIFANKFRKILITQFESNTLFELQKFRLAKTPLNLSVAVTKKINFIPRIGTLMNFDHKVPPKLAI